MLIAIDDTDDPQGGCTTWTAVRLVTLLAQSGAALRGMPRLVRLNPNVPYKTRGNAAVVLDLATPTGPRVQIGEVDGIAIHAYPEGDRVALDDKRLAGLWQTVQEAARPGSHPALLGLREAPPPALYRLGVTTEFPADDALQAATDLGAQIHGTGTAIAGCLAAAAWPGPASSYELIAYRAESHIGAPRQVDPAPLGLLDGQGMFHTIDPEGSRPACIPATPCPVLAGLRARDPDPLVEVALPALRRAAREPIRAWVLWSTNQASGDHVVPVDTVAAAPTWATARVRLAVAEEPRRSRGGHAFVRCLDAGGASVEVAAFEPTGRFRDIVMALTPEDEVEVTGALRDGTIAAEKMEIVSLASKTERGPAPVCACGSRMKSAGAGAGYRCRSCGKRRSEDEARVDVDRSIDAGRFEVPVRARRHLHRPNAWED